MAEDDQVIIPDIGFSGEERGDDVFFFDAAGEDTMFRSGKKRFKKDRVKIGTIKTARGQKITSASGPLSHLSTATESPSESSKTLLYWIVLIPLRQLSISFFPIAPSLGRANQ